MRDTSIARYRIADHLRKRAARNLGVTGMEPRRPSGRGVALQNDLGIIVGRPAEFERPDDSGFFTDDARLRFLWWLSVLKPEILRELQGQVAALRPERRSTAVKRWCERHNLGADWIEAAAVRTANVMADPEAYEEHRALQRTIRGIRRSYGYKIDEPQMEWIDVRFTVPPEGWDAPHAAALIESLGLPGWWADMPAFQFEHRAWDPLNEPESTFRDSARQAFESALEWS